MGINNLSLIRTPGRQPPTLQAPSLPCIVVGVLHVLLKAGRGGNKPPQGATGGNGMPNDRECVCRLGFLGCARGGEGRHFVKVGMVGGIGCVVGGGDLWTGLCLKGVRLRGEPMWTPQSNQHKPTMKQTLRPQCLKSK